MNNGHVNHIHYTSTYFKPDSPLSKIQGVSNNIRHLRQKQRMLAAYQILFSLILILQLLTLHCLQ
jgi:hypothetical protein